MDDDPAHESGESDAETQHIQEVDFYLHETTSFDEMGELGASDSESHRGSSDDGTLNVEDSELQSRSPNDSELQRMTFSFGAIRGAVLDSELDPADDDEPESGAALI